MAASAIRSMILLEALEESARSSWLSSARWRWEVLVGGGGELDGGGLGPGRRLGFFEQWEERWPNLWTLSVVRHHVHGVGYK